MIRSVLLLAFLALVGCKEDTAQDVSAVVLDDNALGHYCQMNLIEHEGPKAQAHLAGLPGAPLFFSQVRDVVAYLRMPEQSHEVLQVWVNDMGAPGASWAEPGIANWIDAGTAHYVVGSGMEGSMGAPELVPFADPGRAAEFAARHGGDILTLGQIPDSAVLAPVSQDTSADERDFQERLRVLSRETGD